MGSVKQLPPHSPAAAIPSTASQRLLQACEEELHGLRDRDLLRTLATVEEVRGDSVLVAGTWLVSWCTNDYLGLSRHPRLVRAACEAAQRWGIGARASRLLAGSTALHVEFEERLASFFRAPSSVVFASGYLTNLGVLTALLGPKDLVLVDRLAHASLIDACRASRATLRVFQHNDADHVARLLTRHRARGRRPVVVTEGVFSMDGDAAPLEQLVEVTRQREALLYLDDAHGVFAVGDTGRGSPEAAGVPHEAMLYMGTLGKALGCQGGFVVGPASLITLIHNRARTFIYSTAPATPVIAAALEGLRFVEDNPAPRRRLTENVRRLHARLKRLGVVSDRAPSHIVPIVVGSSSRARALASALFERGIFAPAIRPPTVPEGTSRLRISVSALHTRAHLDELAVTLGEELSALNEAGKTSAVR